MTNKTVDIVAHATLTPREQHNKTRNLAIIRSGKKHFMRTGRALYRYHRDKLWREDYSTFRAFVETELGWTYQRAMQVVAAISISTVVDIQIPNERVGRAILKLPEADRGEVLLLAHRASAGELDSGWIKDAAEVHQEIKATGSYVDNENGDMSEAQRAVVDHRLERLNRQRQHIADSIDGKFKQERIIDNAPCTVVRVSGATGIVVLKFEPGIARRIALIVGELRVTVAQPKVKEAETEIEN